MLAITMVAHQTHAFTWSNWARNQICQVDTLLKPETKQDLIDIIQKNFRSSQKTIKVAGSGHSWSPLVCNNDTLISVKRLQKIINVDKKAGTITVEAGALLKDINEKLDMHDLALANQTAIMDQTAAGVISTATHGTGHTGTFSKFVKEINIITPEGADITVNASSDPLLFKAVTTHIGSLGVIYSITFTCVPQFYLEYTKQNIDKETFFTTYKKLIQDHDFVQFAYNTHDSDVTVHIYDKTSPLNKKARVSFQALSSYDAGGLRLEEEIAIPHEKLESALKDIDQLVDTHSIKHSMLQRVFCRFTQADDSLISMSSGRKSIYLSISSPVDNKYLAFFKDFEEKMMAYKGRPHWGKNNFLNYQKKLYVIRELLFIVQHS
jgi:FAD/FMN-containing dehydrogenase